MECIWPQHQNTWNSTGKKALLALFGGNIETWETPNGDQEGREVEWMIMAARITYFWVSKADSRSLKVLYSLESLETFKNNGAKPVLFQGSL